MVGGKLATHDARRLHVRHRPVARHAAARVRRAVPGRPGRSLADEVDLVRLDPQFRYHWPDGPTLTVPDDSDATAAAFEEFADGAGDAVASLRRPRPADLGRQRAHVPRRTDDEPRGRSRGACGRRRPDRDRPVPHAAPLGRRRTSTTTGSSSGPGGTRRTRARRRSGRRPRWPASRTSRRATAAGTRWVGSTRSGPRSNGVAARVRRRDPDRNARSPPSRPTPIASPASTSPTAPSVAADVVVANADAEHLYADLLPDAAALRRVRRAERSTSGFALVRRGARPDAGHRAPQRVVLRRRPRPSSTAIGRGRDSPTTRRSTPASRRSPIRRRHPTAARTGSCSSTRRRASRSTPDRARDLVLDRLAARGVDLRDRVEFVRHDHAGRHRRALPVAGRRDLRHVVERPAGRVPPSRQPWQPRAGCTSSADRAIPAAGCRSW